MENIKGHLEDIRVYLNEIGRENKLIYEGFKYLSGNFNGNVNNFDSAVSSACIVYLKNINAVQRGDLVSNARTLNLKRHYDVFIKFQNGLRDIMNKYSDTFTLNSNLVPIICYNDNIQSNKLNLSIINKYCGSHYYNEYYSDRRTYNGYIYIDHDSKNEELLIKYMNDENELIDDINDMNFEEKLKFLQDLDFFNLPVKAQYLSILGFNKDNRIMEGWRKRKMIMVDDEYFENISKRLRKSGKIEEMYNGKLLNEIKYDDENNCFGIAVEMKYPNIIDKYLNNDKEWRRNVLLVRKLKYSDLLNDMNTIELKLDEEDKSKLKLEWMRSRKIWVNNDYKESIDRYLKSNDKFIEIYENNISNEIYDAYDDILYINIELKYYDVIIDYITHDKQFNIGILKRTHDYNIDDLNKELQLLGIHLSEDEIIKLKELLLFSPSLILNDTRIVDKKYDQYLNNWLEYKYKWKYIYRASEHEFTAKSFHDYCDDVGPTLIIIKSQNGYIFGGYTTKSWKKNDNGNEFEYKLDNDAFLFTLYNAHSILPTRYNALKNKGDIRCNPNRGPMFGVDIYINVNNKNCNEEKSCWIGNNGCWEYECDRQYKMSLFVNTDGPNDTNWFSVEDYEVFAINFKDLEMVMNITGYSYEIPGLEIIEKPLIYPSVILCGTKIVKNKYDYYLREWLGNEYEWKCIYRASEHGYTAKSFHEYCDEKGPTLIIIKSRNGYIFGGYTTRSWKINNNVNGEYKVDNNAFIFTLYNAHDIPPTRYNALRDMGGIECDPNKGPIFGMDIYINFNGKNCNEKSNCAVYNDGTRGYECHPKYKRSLFVNTNGSNNENYFSVSDYEVFVHK